MPAAAANILPESLETFDEYAERLQKSREFGAAHRANVEASIALHEADLEALRNDHAVLRGVVPIRQFSAPDTALPFSPSTVELLDIQRVCPIVALALLEIIALRRNTVHFSSYDPDSTSLTDALQNVMHHAQSTWFNSNQQPRFDCMEQLHAAWANVEVHLPRCTQFD